MTNFVTRLPEEILEFCSSDSLKAIIRKREEERKNSPGFDHGFEFHGYLIEDNREDKSKAPNKDVRICVIALLDYSFKNPAHDRETLIEWIGAGEHPHELFCRLTAQLFPDEHSRETVSVVYDDENGNRQCVEVDELGNFPCSPDVADPTPSHVSYFVDVISSTNFKAIRDSRDEFRRKMKYNLI